MDNAGIVAKIKAILEERFGIESASLNEHSRLRDIGVDSLHVVEIMLDLESDLGTKLEDLSVPPNPSLGEVALAIEKNLLPRALSSAQ